MRFLFVHQNFPGQFRHVAAALAARGHEVVALGVNRGDPIAGVKHLLYAEPKLDHKTSSRNPMAATLDELRTKVLRGEAAARAMRELQAQGFDPDVVAVHSGWGEALFVKDVFPKARMVAYAEYYYGAPGGDTAFDPEFSAADGTLARQRVHIKNTHLLHALNDCDMALAPTEFQKSQHPPWAQERIRVIHEGIATERFRPDPQARVKLRGAKLELKPGDEVVTFVVRQLEPYRGYHVFMRALPLLQKLRPNARVVLVGGDGTSYGAPPPQGTWRKIFLDEVAANLDMERVHFVGRVPHTVLTQLMQVSALHVYLTYPFVLSWSLLEAMSIGCLVLASDTAPVREVIDHGKNGLLTPFFDVEALAHAMADALDRGPALKHLREAARQTVVSRFDLESTCLPAQVELFEKLGLSPPFQ